MKQFVQQDSGHSESPRHCNCETHVQILLRAAGVGSLEEARARRRANAAPALGQHRNERPCGIGVLYVEALAAQDTINTLPEKTLLAFAAHGAVKDLMPRDGGDAEEVLAAFAYEA
jgi:hypothetical protein